jgi:hypothetical protein
MRVGSKDEEKVKSMVLQYGIPVPSGGKILVEITGVFL